MCLLAGWCSLIAAVHMAPHVAAVLHVNLACTHVSRVGCRRACICDQPHTERREMAEQMCICVVATRGIGAACSQADMLSCCCCCRGPQCAACYRRGGPFLQIFSRNLLTQLRLTFKGWSDRAPTGVDSKHVVLHPSVAVGAKQRLLPRLGCCQCKSSCCHPTALLPAENSGWYLARCCWWPAEGCYYSWATREVSFPAISNCKLCSCFEGTCTDWFMHVLYSMALSCHVHCDVLAEL